ncbi:MAG TPA: hypothetical protein VHK67_07345 [Rhabdochlamydiaceae bacterium]|nr:hypothetical protein [Rhabdochlamydiaceae bacterium]
MSVFLSASSTASNGILAGASTDIKATYSPKEFVFLLQKKPPYPSNIIVEGDVNLTGSRGLTSLPEGSTIKGNLNLSGCTAIRSLPERLIVEGDVILSDSGLASLPDWITTLGPLADGKARRIHVDGIKLPKAYREKLFKAYNRGGIEVRLTTGDGIDAFLLARPTTQ